MCIWRAKNGTWKSYKASVVCMGLGIRLMGAIFLVCFKLLALHAEIKIWFGC